MKNLFIGLSPLGGVSLSSSIHCGLLAHKHMTINKEEIGDEKLTKKSFEIFSACLVRTPVLPYLATIDPSIKDVLNATGEAFTGLSYGLDGYAAAVVKVEIEGMDQLAAASEGLDEMPMAKVLIDSRLERLEGEFSRLEVASLILSELEIQI